MTKEELSSLLQQYIPLCRFMKIAVNHLDLHSIETSAPLEENKNMHGTGFAGSLYALSVATGWGLVHNRIETIGINGQLVVKEATIHYKRPVTSDISLKAELPVGLKDDAILNDLDIQKRALFPLIINIISKGKVCGYLEAEYVVVKNKTSK